jgi:hypothetical protein
MLFNRSFDSIPRMQQFRGQTSSIRDIETGTHKMIKGNQKAEDTS